LAALVFTTAIARKDATKTRGETDRAKLAQSDGLEADALDFDWSNEEVIEPESKKAISLRIDPAVLAFFKSHSKGYQTRMNAVLMAYVTSQSR